jgi:uncharacterized NAD(P)/FAD-binding protein YdhS
VLSLHLLRHCPPHTRISLIERSRLFGVGTAYSTGNASHLLNVPVARMSTFYDRPHDFLEWLQQRAPGDTQSAASFVPRQLYGEYIRQLLNSELKQPQQRNRLKLVHGNVVSLDRSGHPLVLRTDQGETITSPRTAAAARSLFL